MSEEIKNNPENEGQQNAEEQALMSAVAEHECECGPEGCEGGGSCCGHDHHHHDHGHDHMMNEEDPAAKSLSDALNVSFKILKFIMIVLVVAYAFSGIFRVEPQKKAVRLIFGKIVGQPGEQVLDEGWYLNLPYPFGQSVTVPTNPQDLNVMRDFWYQVLPGDEKKSTSEKARPLNPEFDGSLITGDANLVHGRFKGTYKVIDFVSFIENIGTIETATLDDDVMLRATDIVTQAINTGVVHAVSEVTADDYIEGRANMSKAKVYAQKILDELGSGIEIEYIQAINYQMPLAVDREWKAVSEAENERGEKIQRAEQERLRILVGTAGKAHDELYKLVLNYQLSTGDEAAAYEKQIDRALRTLSVADENGKTLPIGGDAAAIIKRAVSDRTRVVEKVRGEVATFETLLGEYRANPLIFKNRFREAAREEIFKSKDVETFYTVDGQLYLELNRDPEVARKREEMRLKAQEQRLAVERQQNQ